ncbi:MAG: hypothetical protein JXD21_06880 [Candidatus Omnitrophica bacterium]|nr:hypothetical protein [Candidatus Omnitrophota bacterium]
MLSGDMFQKGLIACVIIAILSVFIPIIHFNLPVVGEQSVSMIGMISGGGGGSSGQTGTTPTRRQSSQMPQVKLDLNGIKDMMNNPSYAETIKENPELAFIPTGFLGGIIAHIFLIPLLILILFKKRIAAMITAVFTFILSLGFLRSTALLNGMFRESAEKVTQQMKGSSGALAGLTKMFNQVQEQIQNMSVDPGPAIFIILIMMALIAIGCVFSKRLVKT